MLFFTVPCFWPCFGTGREVNFMTYSYTTVLGDWSGQNEHRHFQAVLDTYFSYLLLEINKKSVSTLVIQYFLCFPLYH